jgi:hypothetical protein
MAGARSHKDLICWQRAYELKLHVYELIRAGTITGDTKLREQLRESAAAAPRLMAEGFGPLQRLAKRSSKAATNLIGYLRTADPPNEPAPPRKRRRRREPEPREPEPREPEEPMEPNEQDP